MSHGDTVFSIPAHYEVLASTENCPVAASRYKKKPITVCSGTRKLCTQKKEHKCSETSFSKFANVKPTGKRKISWKK